MPTFCQKDGIQQSGCNFQAMQLSPIKKAWPKPGFFEHF
jgi:hypothetical protein